MTDGIIKGTGNSRYLRGPANIKTLYPTYDDLLDALAAGTLPIDLNGINPAGWETVGNRLDKATLLADDTATGMGLTAAATPNTAFSKLRQLIATAQSDVDNGVKIATGSYTGTNKYGKSNPNSLTLPFKPKIVFVSGLNSSSDTGPGFMYVWGLNNYTLLYASYSGTQVNSQVSISENKMTWYSSQSVAYQANLGGQYYYYVIFG